MADCKRDWSEGEGCAGCWASIATHLMLTPNDRILPKPNFCQDAAFVAFVLDGRSPMGRADPADPGRP